MKKINVNILTDRVLRIKLIRQEFLYKIIKGILQNNNITSYRKNYYNTLLTTLNSGKKKLSRRKATCLITGSRHSITQTTNFCRQQNKRLIILNRYSNIKVAI